MNIRFSSAIDIRETLIITFVIFGVLSLKIVAIILSVYSVSFLFCGVAFTVHTQSDLKTTKYRNTDIDLGNGIKTDARLNLPAIGNGPFPAVLLVHGSGHLDMNETLGYVRIDNETGLRIYPARPFFQIAEYLSERGFVVLQYNKRGVDANLTVSDSNVWGNVTFNDLKQDAEKALEVLIRQPEVDANKITLIGHSEGTLIAPRVAIDNPDKVDNIVLLGSVAQNLREILYFQSVTLPILYAQQILDHGHSGLISVQEVSENPIFKGPRNLTLFHSQNSTAANKTAGQLSPPYDTLISINAKLKPELIDRYKSFSVLTPGEKCVTVGICPTWVASHYSLTPTLNIIDKVPTETSILIQQGENDSQTTIKQAFLLQQKLTEVGHPDHTLISYPDLGHVFYPSSQWYISYGPIEQEVLQDLFGWLSDPIRDSNR
jgi:alpha-beta hydrolase superfamily lysophospholipase